MITIQQIIIIVTYAMMIINNKIIMIEKQEIQTKDMVIMVADLRAMVIMEGEVRITR